MSDGKINPFYNNRGVFQDAPEVNTRVRQSGQNVPPDYRQIVTNIPGYEGLSASPEMDRMLYYAVNKPIIWTLENYSRLDSPGVYISVFDKAPRKITIENFGPGNMCFTFDTSTPLAVTLSAPNNNFLNFNQQKTLRAGLSRTWSDLRLLMQVYPGYVGPVWVFSLFVDAANTEMVMELQFTEIASNLNGGAAPV